MLYPIQSQNIIFDDTLRLQFTGTSHHIGGHVIEFDDPRLYHAVGVGVF